MNRMSTTFVRFSMICGIALASGMLAVMAGCSSSAMKSAPLWDPSSSGAATLSDMEYKKAEGPPEDRVNLWPVYYYRKPATSVLWPMIAVTDEGNAVIPFYEYLYKDKELRMGMIHHYVPALANVNGAKDCYRILTFFKGPDATWFFPFFYKDSDTYRSLLYTRTRSDWKDLDGILGPLFFIKKTGKDKQDTSAFYPFPIFEYWNHVSDKGSMALPLYYFEWNKAAKRMAALNLAGLLFHLDLDNHWYFYLAGLGAGSHEKYSAGETKANGFDYCFPFFIFSRDGAEYYQSILFPFFHRFGDKEGDAQTLFPVYYYSHYASGYKRTVTALFGFDNEGTWYHVAGPMYFYSNRDGVTWRSFLWPLFWSRQDKDSLYRSCLFPLWHEYRDNDTRRTILAPLFWSEKGAKSWAWLSPLVSFGRGKDGTSAFFNLCGLLYHYSTDAYSTTQYCPWPFFG
ncbi:MAG: hypothetical protein NTX50_15860, partial [Candidatus Sumerlaeota bacterium]|nr:hypothetical protein [Candidatus Sumerlaeota bacterium]